MTMNNVIYIAFYGKKRAGKTTVAKQILSILEKDHHVTILSFADRLRQAYDLFFPETPPWLELDAETKAKHRPFMQVCGDAAKLVDPNYFTNDLIARAEHFNFTSGLSSATKTLRPYIVLVDDLRFDFEYTGLANTKRPVHLIELTSSLQQGGDSHNSEKHTGLKELATHHWHNQLRPSEGLLVLRELNIPGIILPD